MLLVGHSSVEYLICFEGMKITNRLIGFCEILRQKYKPKLNIRTAATACTSDKKAEGGYGGTYEMGYGLNDCQEMVDSNGWVG